VGIHCHAQYLNVKKQHLQLNIVIFSLQNRGVFGSFTLIEEFACDLFPFDNDLMSMELDSAFKVRNFCFITSLYAVFERKQDAFFFVCVYVLKKLSILTILILPPKFQNIYSNAFIEKDLIFGQRN